MLKPEYKNSFIKYKLIEHLSDVGIKVCGNNIIELFENAAEGMFSLITDLNNVKKIIEKEILIHIEEKIEIEDFLIAWLEKLLYLCETEGIIFSYFKIKDFRVNDRQSSILALIEGERINLKKHEMLSQIKAPTYHNLHIHKENNKGGYIVEIIFDV